MIVNNREEAIKFVDTFFERHSTLHLTQSERDSITIDLLRFGLDCIGVGRIEGCDN